MLPEYVPLLSPVRIQVASTDQLVDFLVPLVRLPTPHLRNALRYDDVFHLKVLQSDESHLFQQILFLGCPKLPMNEQNPFGGMRMVSSCGMNMFAKRTELALASWQQV